MVVLNEPTCEKLLPIWIGVHEASAICWAMQDIRTSRPLTHQLLLNTIKALNYEVEKVEINEIKDRAFLATIHVVERSQDGTNSEPLTRQIDARPSDAIVLALLSSAPIYVSPFVLEQAAVSTKEDTESESLMSSEDDRLKDDESFKKFIQGVKASDFKLPGDRRE